MKNIIDHLFKKIQQDFFMYRRFVYVQKIKKKIYKDKLIYKESYRSYKDDAFKIYPRKNHRFRLGKEIIVEALIISKCDGFLSTETNISNFINIIMKNNKPKFYKIENGYNSTNEYYAMWLWYLKSYLHFLVDLRILLKSLTQSFTRSSSFLEIASSKPNFGKL